MGIFGKLFGKKKEKVQEEVTFNIDDLGLLSELAPSEKLKERFRNARKMLKQKILENWKVDPDSKEYKELIKLRTLVSSDPETSRLILQAKETYKRVLGTVVVLEFNKEELMGLIDCIAFLRGTGVEELRSKLSDAYSKLLC